MFSNDFCEKSKGEVQLSDIGVSSVKMFLSYLYNDGPKITTNVWEMLNVLEICHKYEVENVYGTCLENIIGNADSHYDLPNILRMLKLGHLFENSNISERAAQWLIR
jgi:BTB/POZ domain